VKRVATLLLGASLTLGPPAAAQVPPVALTDAQAPAEQPAGGWLGRFWETHRWHVLTVFAAQEAEYLYAQQIGTTGSPLLFDDVPRLDRRVRDAWSTDTEPRTWLSQHKTNIFRAVALGTIVAVNRDDWGAAADDALGLLEALKFNSATTRLVKMAVGRRRPALDAADPDVIGQPAFDEIMARGGGRSSFYSEATSQAFTFASYLDMVAARRLTQKPFARAASALGLYGVAAAIGASRIREGQHYLTDVLVGAGAGYFVGRGFYRANHRMDLDEAASRDEARRIRFTPPMPAPGGGVMVWASIGL
jgi:hypothetical protein